LHDYFILWKPRDIVSGDFYWVKQIGELVVIVVADCTGHGVPGSFMSALGIAFLNEIINRQKIIRSNEILEEMRLLVKTSLNQEGHAELSKDGMDMALCVLDKKNNRLFFSGANNPLYIYRSGQILEFDSTRNPIGVHLVEKKFNVHEVALESTDVCYLFTDGYTDMMGGVSDKKFTKQRFRNLLIDINIKGLNMEKQKRFLDDTINNWLGEKFKQIDDILVLGFIP